MVRERAESALRRRFEPGLLGGDAGQGHGVAAAQTIRTAVRRSSRQIPAGPAQLGGPADCLVIRANDPVPSAVLRGRSPFLTRSSSPALPRRPMAVERLGDRRCRRGLRRQPHLRQHADERLCADDRHRADDPRALRDSPSPRQMSGAPIRVRGGGSTLRRSSRLAGARMRVDRGPARAGPRRGRRPAGLDRDRHRPGGAGRARPRSPGLALQLLALSVVCLPLAAA